MPERQHDTPTSPKDAGKNYQVTSVSSKNCYKLREPLTKLQISSNRNVCEHTDRDTKDKRHGKPSEHGGVCCTHQETDTSGEGDAEEITHKYHKITSDKNEDIPTASTDCATNVTSLGSGILPVIKDGTVIASSINCHVSEQKYTESGLEKNVTEQKDKDSVLDCHVSEDKDTQVEDCLYDPSNGKSQASFLVRVNDHTQSCSDDDCASLHLHGNPTNESVSNHVEATIGELTCTARSGNTTGCERKIRPNTNVTECSKCDTTCEGITTRPNTNVTECSKCDTTCEGITTRENITQLPLNPKHNSVQQDRSVRGDGHQSTRTTIELNAHSLNSGRKYSDFSISFLLGSPSMRGTIRCQQTKPRRLCEHERHNCHVEAFCGNNPTSCSCANTQPTCSCANTQPTCSCANTQPTCSSANNSTHCSCDVSTCNQQTTKCRRDDNCPSRQTLTSAARCCDKQQSGCSSSVGPFTNKESPRRSHSQALSLLTTSSRLCHTDQEFNNSWTQSTGNHFESTIKGEASGDEMLADSETRCSTPVRKQLKRTWTADDNNTSQTQTEHNSSMDSSMLTGTSKMARFKYTEEQTLYLRAEFNRNRYPSYDDLAKMSEDTTVPVRQLQVWFQNKRASTTGTRRPKMRRIDDYPEFDHHSKPPTAGAEVAHPIQPCHTLPSSCADSKVHSPQTGPVIQDYGHQTYIPRMFADFLGHHQDLHANTFTNGPSLIAQTQQRHLLPVQYPAHVYPGAALHAGSLQAYLNPLYGNSLGVGLGYPDINSLQMFNSYMAHSGALSAAPQAGNSQLLALLGHPGVHRTPSASNPRDLNPADIFLTSLLPQTSNPRDNGKLP